MQAAGRFVVLGAFVALTAQASAQSSLPLKHAPARTQTAITPADLMTRLYLYADDSMMGRLAGSDPGGVTREEVDELFATHIDYLIDGIRRDRA